MISDVNAYVIFDCKKPSYLKSGNQLVVLKNHIINYDIERRKDPRVNESSAYICDKTENVWRINPGMFKRTGFIAFDDDKPADADNNFITLADEKTIKDYLVNIDENKISDKIIELAFKITHHPKYYKADKTKKPKVVDVIEEQDKKLPKWLKNLRTKQIEDLYSRLTKKSNNFTVEKHPKLREETFGDGYSYMLFDCDNPSYYYPKDEKNVALFKIESKEYKLLFNKMGYCNKNDKIWRSGKKPAGNKDSEFLTFDAKGKGLGFSPSVNLLKILKLKALCDDYMKYMFHPSYFNKKFKKPIQCTSKAGEQEEEKKIVNIINSHKNKATTRKGKHFEEPNDSDDSSDSSDSGVSSE